VIQEAALSRRSDELFAGDLVDSGGSAKAGRVGMDTSFSTTR
jgi:hypothetical protein